MCFLVQDQVQCIAQAGCRTLFGPERRTTQSCTRCGNLSLILAASPPRCIIGVRSDSVPARVPLRRHSVRACSCQLGAAWLSRPRLATPQCKGSITASLRLPFLESAIDVSCRVGSSGSILSPPRWESYNKLQMNKMTPFGKKSSYGRKAN